MALLLLPTSITRSVSRELSPSVLEISVVDAVPTFSSVVKKQWIQEKDPNMLSVHANNLKTDSRVDGFQSRQNKCSDIFLWFFLLRLKSIGKTFKLGAKQLRKRIKKYRRNESEASDIFFTEILWKHWQRVVI